MDKFLADVLSQLPAPEIPDGLEDRILARVRRASMRGLYARLTLSVAGCAAGLAYAAVAGRTILAAIQQSAAVGLLRLAFTDPDIVFGNLQDSFLGLVENIPFGTIALGAGVVFSAICAVEFALALRHAKHRPTALISA